MLEILICVNWIPHCLSISIWKLLLSLKSWGSHGLSTRWSLRKLQVIYSYHISFGWTFEAKCFFQTLISWVLLSDGVCSFIQFNKFIWQITFAIVFFQLTILKRTSLWIFVGEEGFWAITKCFWFLTDIHVLLLWMILVDTYYVITHWSLHNLHIIFGH